MGVPTDDGNTSPCSCQSMPRSILSSNLDDVVKARADAVLDKIESIPTIVEEVRRLAGR